MKNKKLMKLLDEEIRQNEILRMEIILSNSFKNAYYKNVQLAHERIKALCKKHEEEMYSAKKTIDDLIMQIKTCEETRSK